MPSAFSKLGRLLTPLASFSWPLITHLHFVLGLSRQTTTSAPRATFLPNPLFFSSVHYRTVLRPGKADTST